MSNHEWTPYIPAGYCTRVVETSCCGLYQLLQEGGAHVVTRRGRHPTQEETARGPGAMAKDAFHDLVALHLTGTTKHRP